MKLLDFAAETQKVFMGGGVYRKDFIPNHDLRSFAVFAQAYRKLSLPTRIGKYSNLQCSYENKVFKIIII